VQVDRPFGRVADDQLLHVHVRRAHEAALVTGGQHRNCVVLAHGCHAGAVDRVDRDVDAVAASANVLADVEHGGFVDLAFADDDFAVDLDLVQYEAHRLHGGAIGLVLVTAAKPFVAGQRGGFGDTGEFDRKFASHALGFLSWAAALVAHRQFNSGAGL